MKREFLRNFNIDEDIVNKIMAENGKDIESQKNKTKIAEEKVAKYKAELEIKTNEYYAKLSEIEFNYVLKDSLSEIKFSSNLAKEGAIQKIKNKGLKSENNEILDLEDTLKTLQEEYRDAFMDEAKEKLPQKIKDFIKKNYKIIFDILSSVLKLIK